MSKHGLLSKIRRTIRHLPHLLHIGAGYFAFAALFETNCESPGKDAVRVTLHFLPDEFSWRHQGLYIGMLGLASIIYLRIKWHYLFYRNSEIPEGFTELPKQQLDRILNGTFSDRWQLRLDPITEETFTLFLDFVNKAYPTGIVSPMTHDDRKRYYGKWLTSPDHFMVLVKKIKANKQDGDVVGFYAACRVNYSFFRKLISDDAGGLENSKSDLGGDENCGFTFVEIKHWYIRHRSAPPEAMIWLLGKAFEFLIRPATVPVVYGHTVTPTGRHNYGAAGFANYGENSAHCTQFALDGRRDIREQSRPGAWTLETLCRTTLKADFTQEIYVRSSE